MNIDELIDKRKTLREFKDFAGMDEIRDYLDTQLVFIFDTPWGQQVYYLTEKYFKKKPETMTHRKYVEKRIQDDIRAEKLLNAWIYTNRI